MLITTIIARNYLAHARVLARSFLAHHPDGRVVVLLIDPLGAANRTAEPFEVVTPTDLAIEPAEFRRMATMYDATELATAVKPWLLRHLLDVRGEEAVTYLDPDIVVLAPLAPGTTQIVPVWVAAPANAGDYVLEFDLVHEFVRWFDRPLEVVVRVGAGRAPSDSPSPTRSPRAMR